MIGTERNATQEPPRRSFGLFRGRRRRGPLGCLVQRITLILLTLVIAFGASAACFLFAPVAYQSLLTTVRSAGLKSYVTILRVIVSPALKIVTSDVQVTAIGSVNRDMGVFSLLYGEGAQVIGTVRVSLGADLLNNKFGVLSCDIDAGSIRTTNGRAPLASSAFDPEQIKQQAYLAFENDSARQALDKGWALARAGLQKQFVSWGLGLQIPEQPTLTECPVIVSSQVTATPPAQ